MIAGLFYPKELKDIVADLRVKGDLNEKALKSINKPIYGGVFISIIMSVFFIYDKSLFASIVFPFLLLVFTRLEAKQIYNFCMLPYLGAKQEVSQILKVEGVYVLATQVTLIQESTKEFYVIKPSSKWLNVGIPKVGDKMQIFVNPRYSGFAMPNNTYFKQEYSLRKSLVELREVL